MWDLMQCAHDDDRPQHFRRPLIFQIFACGNWKMMRVLGIVVGLLAIGVAGFIAWYKVSYPTYSYRYRLTVEVLVDGQTKSGSSVIEVNLAKQPQWFVPLPPVSISIIGEAVLVDLGEGKNVLALLASGPTGSNADYPSEIIPKLSHLSYEDRNLPKFFGLSGAWTLPKDRLPTLVTLSDLRDPNTVRVLDPAALEQDLGRQFKLKDVVVQMTRDPITRGITTVVPWVGNYAAETEFERALRAVEGGIGPAMAPGLKLKRGS
jgi:hypothetical protein